ncbi:hypothetical protein C8R44DRAFT_788554 [Mycena epipterygia]|nr:hypothetical protein C8R44DRAFT_788554 [Mycena epipterygia]
MIVGSFLENQHRMFSMMENLGNHIVDSDRQMKSLQERVGALEGEVLATQGHLLYHQRDYIAHVEQQEREDMVVEKHESILSCLQAFNDIIFNVNRPARNTGTLPITQTLKDALRKAELGYITHLFDPPNRLLPLAEDVKKNRDSALAILTPVERSLCNSLVMSLKQGRDKRNRQQHRKPDRATAFARLQQLGLGQEELFALRSLLETDPKRIRTEKDKADTDLRIFAPDGTYNSVSMKNAKLEEMRAETEEVERRRSDFERDIQAVVRIQQTRSS